MRHEAFLKSLGATHIVDRNADLTSEVKKIVGGTPIEVVYNIATMRSKEGLEETWELVAPGGTLIIAMPPPPPAYLKEKHTDRYIANVFGDYRFSGNDALGQSLYAKLTDLLEDGSIKVRASFVRKFCTRLTLSFQPNRVEVLPNGLHGIAEGFQKLQENKVSGVKLVARPQETA